MNILFVDASFWIALLFPPDSHHDVAVRRWRKVMEEGWDTITTNWTMYEALTYLSGQKWRHDLALDLLRLVKSSTIILDASQYETRALEVFTSHSDKAWSVVDCANFVCIQDRRSMWAMAFDADFTQAQAEFGFTMLGLGAVE